MANINISIKEEAYQYLKMLKGKDKSFSDVIIELKDNKTGKGTAKSLLKYAGKLKHLDAKKFDKIREDLNEGLNKRVKEAFDDRN